MAVSCWHHGGTPRAIGQPSTRGVMPWVSEHDERVGRALGFGVGMGHEPWSHGAGALYSNIVLMWQQQPHPTRCNNGTSRAAEYFAVPEPERGLGATAATFGTLQEDKLVAWMVQYQPYTPLT